jgi:hypothetical protein
MEEYKGWSFFVVIQDLCWEMGPRLDFGMMCCVER